MAHAHSAPLGRRGGKEEGGGGWHSPLGRAPTYTPVLRPHPRRPEDDRLRRRLATAVLAVGVDVAAGRGCFDAHGAGLAAGAVYEFAQARQHCPGSHSATHPAIGVRHSKEGELVSQSYSQIDSDTRASGKYGQ